MNRLRFIWSSTIAVVAVVLGKAGSWLAEPKDILANSLSHFRKAKRLAGPGPSYAKDNPLEYQKVLAYLDGGARPDVTTEMGQGLVLEEDARRALAGTVVVPPPPPPVTGTLRWKPPGYDGSGDPRDAANYPGYVVRDVMGNGFLNLDDSTDYFLRLGDLNTSSVASGRTYTVGINGGRNVVLIGGSINFTPLRKDDDEVAIQIDDGDPLGIVHIEGVNIHAVNGITVRSQRTVQIENVRIEVHAFNDDFSGGVHPDIVQIWDRGPCKLRTDHLTGYSVYSGLSALFASPNAPVSWDRYNVDIHAAVKLTGGLPDINPAQYLGGTTHYTGDNLWLQGGYYSSTIKRKLDDLLLGYGSASPQANAPYELHGINGELYTSPLSPTGGNAPYPLGSRQGDTITFTRASQIGGAIDELWTYGLPPNGEFVPAASVGTGYVSPGYQ
jgi:hypothetical protein